jgi:hypothetical protein
MLTFREFHSICEGKKKELVAAYLAGREQASPEIKDYGDSAPNSPERDAQIKAMMRDSGGGAIKKAQKQRLKQAVKAVKRIQKNQQFTENISQFRKDLETLEKQSAPKQRLAAKRDAARKRMIELRQREKQKKREYQERQAQKDT